MIAALEGRLGRFWTLAVAMIAALVLGLGVPTAAHADEPTGSISGTIISPDLDGVLTETVTVSLYRLDGDAWDYVSDWKTNATFSFDSVPVGTYTVFVKTDEGSSYASVWSGGRPTKASAAKLTVTESKDTDATITLTHAAELTGKVSTSTGDAILGAVVSISMTIGGESIKVADVETDPLGYYELTGLLPGAYSLQFTATLGSASRSDTKTATLADRGRGVVDVSFAAPVTVTGTVRDSDGKAVPAAKVTLTRPGAASPTATLTASGSGGFSFSQVDAGNYSIGASLNSTSVQQSFTFSDGIDADVTVTLPRRGAITGSILDATGAPVSGAAVAVWRADGSKAAITTSGADGAFRVIGLADGSYTVSGGLDASTPLAYLGGAVRLRDAQFRVLSGGASIATPAVRFPDGATASGRVTAAGTGVAGAEVSLYRTSGGVAARVSTDSAGAFTAAGLAPGAYLVGITAPDGSPLADAEIGAAAFTVVGTAAVSVPDIALTTGGTLTGAVVTIASAAVPSATVELYRRSGAGGLAHVRDVTTSSAGAFSASGLAAGTYTVAVRPSGSSVTTWLGGATSSAAAATVSITAGATAPAVRVVLPFATGVVRGTITAPQADAAARAASVVVLRSTTDAALVLTSTPTAAGVFSFSSVPDGTYTLASTALAGYADTWFGGAARATDATVITVRGGGSATANITPAQTGALISGYVEADERLAADATITALRRFADGTVANAGAVATISPDSSYRIDGLVVGATYVLRADVGAPQAEYIGGASPATATPFTATGEGIEQDLVLATRGGIHGSAHDASGSLPVDGMIVTVFDGATAIATTTIADGDYRVDRLLPGAYTVRFGDPGDASAVFASVYTNEATDPAKASAVTVTAGGDTDAGTTLVPRALALSGSATATVAIAGADGVVRLAGATATLASGGTVIARATADAVGAFEFAVAPGSYTICITPPATGASAGIGLTGGCWSGTVDTVASAGAPITVASTDVSDIRIRLAKPAALQALAAGAPALSGTAAVGYALAVAPGTWTSGTTLSYQWLADGAPIAGATTSSIVPSTALAGRALSVRVTGSKPGYTSATKVTASSARVLVWGAVAVSGSAAVGYRLTAIAGTWTSGTAFRYQWYANGVAIKGATKSTFTVTKTQAAKSLSVRVTGVKTGYTTLTRASAGTAKAIVVGSPKISDTTPARKQKITVKAGTWTSGTRIAYQWYLNGIAIKGATKSSLTVSSSWKGKKLSVRVTGSKSGYTTVAVTKGTSAVH